MHLLMQIMAGLQKMPAYALLSRLYLYAASPLFNPTHDNAKWQKAADAAAVFTENDDRGYSLYPDYGNLFNQNSGAAQNEFIFTRNFTSTNFHQAPANNLGRRYGAYGGWWASNGPAQNLVDDYDMINGEPAFTWTGNTKLLILLQDMIRTILTGTVILVLKQASFMILLFSMGFA